MRTKKIKSENEDTMRTHYDLSKLQVRRLGAGWRGRNPFAKTRRNPASVELDTVADELTVNINRLACESDDEKILTEKTNHHNSRRSA